MVHKKDGVLLDNDELELLSEIMLPAQDVDSQLLEYNVNSSLKGESLLFKLGSANELKLMAEYGNHRLVFPVQIGNGDFANLKMTLKPPEIYEIGDIRRAWRLTANNKQIYLVNKAGDELQFQVEDLSASGISFLIDPNSEEEFPEVLDDAFLQLPNREKLPVSGLHITRMDDKIAAYSLGKEVDQAVLAALYEYLFECHVEQFPEAHKD